MEISNAALSSLNESLESRLSNNLKESDNDILNRLCIKVSNLILKGQEALHSKPHKPIVAKCHQVVYE